MPHDERILGRARRAARRRRCRAVAPSCLLALVLAAGVPPAHAEDVDPVALMAKNFVVGRVPDSRSEITMILVGTGGEERRRSTVSFSKLLPNGVDQQRFVRFVAPPELKGTSTLLIEQPAADDDIWVYLPALRKARRLVSSEKKDSFFGSEFSYGDIIGLRPDDWTYTVSGTEVVDGADCVIVDAEPRSAEVRAETGYAKRRLWIRKDNAVMVKALFWDEQEQPLKEGRFSDVRAIGSNGDRWQPFRLNMKNGQSGRATEIVVERMDVGIGIPDEQFTARYLEREN